jgi:hypothetical protein
VQWCRPTLGTAVVDHAWLATTTFEVGVTLTLIGYATGGLAFATDAIVASSHADAAQIRLLFET